MRKYIAIAIVSLFFLSMMVVTVQAENEPYTVYGRVTYDGSGINDAHVTIYDSNTHASISYTQYDTLVTWTGINGLGYYSSNIGNMATAWSRGDVIYVNVTLPVQSMSSSEHFTIPATGYIYEKDMAFSSTTGGTGGQLGEGENQWRSVPGLWEIINWFRSINLKDFIVTLFLFLLVASIIIAIATRKRKR